MISRRALLGTILGIPFAAKVATGAPAAKRPTQPVLKIDPVDLISTDKILVLRAMDVADLLLDLTVKQIRQEGFERPGYEEYQFGALVMTHQLKVDDLHGPIDLVMKKHFTGLPSTFIKHLQEVWYNQTVAACKVLVFPSRHPNHITFELRATKAGDAEPYPERLFYSRNRLIHMEPPNERLHATGC
jgi:hypothetical protein